MVVTLKDLLELLLSRSEIFQQLALFIIKEELLPGLEASGKLEIVNLVEKYI